MDPATPERDTDGTAPAAAAAEAESETKEAVPLENAAGETVPAAEESDTGEMPLVQPVSPDEREIKDGNNHTPGTSPDAILADAVDASDTVITD